MTFRPACSATTRRKITLPTCRSACRCRCFDRNQGAIAQACGELAAAQAALQARELALDQRLSTSMRDYRTARERVTKYASKVLPAARETLDMISTGYQQGELDYVQVLTVQQTYAAKNLSYLQDLETAWKQWAEIEGLLVGDLGQTSIDRTRTRPGKYDWVGRSDDCDDWAKF